MWGISRLNFRTKNCSRCDNVTAARARNEVDFQVVITSCTRTVPRKKPYGKKLGVMDYSMPEKKTQPNDGACNEKSFCEKYLPKHHFLTLKSKFLLIRSA